VTVDSHFWSGRQRVMVGDQRAAVTWGSGKRTFALPTADGGAAEARVSRSIMINPFPTVEVGVSSIRPGQRSRWQFES